MSSFGLLVMMRKTGVVIRTLTYQLSEWMEIIDKNSILGKLRCHSNRRQNFIKNFSPLLFSQFTMDVLLLFTSV